MSITSTDDAFSRSVMDLITSYLDEYDKTGGMATGELVTAICRIHEQRIQDAYIKGEKAGRSDELVKLSDWGKTIDDQWNDHFKKRLLALESKEV